MASSIEQARRNLRRLEDDRRNARRQRRERAIARLGEAARMLRERHGVGDVVVFGSVANGDLSGKIDVDLAVSALDPASYFAALADLMELFGGPVDLVRIEEATGSLLERIAVDGKSL